DQQNDADQRDDAELGLEQQQREQRADAGRRQRGQDRDRMHVAFIKDAQHDIDGQQGRQDQPRLAIERGLERLRGPLETAAYRRRDPELGESPVDRNCRLAERRSLGQIERDRRGDELRLVVDPERRVGRRVVGDRGERNLRAGLRADVDVPERVRRLPVLGRRLHDDVILVERRIDRRHLPLSERVVQRGVDQAGRNPEPRGRVAIDDQRGLQSLVLLVGVDVDQLRQARQRRAYARLPGPQLVEIVRLQRVLVGGVGLAATDADVLHGIEEQVRAGLLGELDAQPRDHLVGRLLAFRERFQRDEHPSGIALRAAGERDDGVDRRIGANDVDEARKLGLHRLERNALVGLDEADQASGVLGGEETLRDDHVQVDVETDDGQQYQHRQNAVLQHPAEALLVAVAQALEAALAPRVQPSVPPLACRTQKPRAHHRRHRQRQHERDQDRHRQRHGELAEITTDDTAHEQNRNEHGDQRQAHRQDGEPDLARTDQRRLERRDAFLDVPRHVFQDDDRIVDDEAGGDGQRHQREVVQAETAQIHDAESRDQRHRDGDAGNQRRPPVAQEDEHDQDDQADGDDQRALDVAQRRSYRRRPLHHDIHLDG